MANYKSLLMLLALSVFVVFLASFTHAEEANVEGIQNDASAGENEAQLSSGQRGRRFPRRRPDAIYRTPTQIIYSNVRKQQDVQIPPQPIVPAVECPPSLQPCIPTETVVRTIVQTATETVPQVIERTLTCTVPRFIERTMTETNVETETVTQRVPQLVERTLTCTIPQVVERTVTETNVETETTTQRVPQFIERTLTCTIPVERTVTETNVETETATETVPQIIERTLTCTIPQVVERTVTCTIPQVVERTLTETLTETQTQSARTLPCPTYAKPFATTERSKFEASSRLTLVGTQKSSFETIRQPAHGPFYGRSKSSGTYPSPTATPQQNGDDDSSSYMSQPTGAYY